MKLSIDRWKTAPLSCAAFVHTFATRMKIRAYLKPSCGWSKGVRAIMSKHGLAYEDIDVVNNRENYEEMVQKSGQPLSPCVEIDGVMLADISGEEVENYLLSNDLIKPSDAPVDVPINAGCSDERRATTAAKTVRFF
jgi:monothiol glutaredoxin